MDIEKIKGKILGMKNKAVVFGAAAVILIVFGLVIGIMIGRPKDPYGGKTSAGIADYVNVSDPADTVGEQAPDEVVVQQKVPYVVDVYFGDALFEEARKESKLIVMTREGSTSYVAEKEGAFGWDVFSQKKAMIFHGKAEYTVDLSQLDSDDIKIDSTKHIITITIPEPELSVEYLPEETEFFDTTNGFLSFGEMNITPEMSNELAVSGKERLKDEFQNDDESWAAARKFAEITVKELYEPVVRSVIDATVKEKDDVYAIAPRYDIVVKTETP
jgi:hypothetical protein